MLLIRDFKEPLSRLVTLYPDLAACVCSYINQQSFFCLLHALKAAVDGNEIQL